MQQIHQKNIIINAPIINIVKAGFLVNIEELLCCITPFMFGLDMKSKILINQIISVKIFNLQTKNKNYNDYFNLTLIHDCNEIKSKLDKYQVGKIVTVTLRAIKSYGLLVNIHDRYNFKLPGIIKRHEITPTSIGRIERIFKVGQEIKAMIIENDLTIPRFSLSAKFSN